MKKTLLVLTVFAANIIYGQNADSLKYSQNFKHQLRIVLKQGMHVSKTLSDVEGGTYLGIEYSPSAKGNLLTLFGGIELLRPSDINPGSWVFDRSKDNRYWSGNMGVRIDFFSLAVMRGASEYHGYKSDLNPGKFERFRIRPAFGPFISYTIYQRQSLNGYSFEDDLRRDRFGNLTDTAEVSINTHRSNWRHEFFYGLELSLLFTYVGEKNYFGGYWKVSGGHVSKFGLSGSENYRITTEINAEDQASIELESYDLSNFRGLFEIGFFFGISPMKKNKENKKLKSSSGCPRF